MMEWKNLWKMWLAPGLGFTLVHMGASALVYKWGWLSMLTTYVPNLVFSVTGLISGTLVYGGVIWTSNWALTKLKIV